MGFGVWSSGYGVGVQGVWFRVSGSPGCCTCRAPRNQRPTRTLGTRPLHPPGAPPASSPTPRSSRPQSSPARYCYQTWGDNISVLSDFISLPAELSVLLSAVPAHNGHLRGKTVFLIHNHDHLTPAREVRRDVRALKARNNPEGQYYPMNQHVFRVEGFGN